MKHSLNSPEADVAAAVLVLTINFQFSDEFKMNDELRKQECCTVWLKHSFVLTIREADVAAAGLILTFDV